MNDVEQWLDREFEPVIERARKQFAAISLPEFMATVTGFLLVSSIKLAHRGGCPRHVLEMAIASRIAKVYGS